MGVSKGPQSRPQAFKVWMQSAGKDIFLSEDFFSGIGAAVLAFFAALLSESIRGDGKAFLGIMAGLGVALSAIVAGVLAIIVTLFDQNYRRTLQATTGGSKSAFRPYRAVGIVSVATTIVAVVGLFIWPVAPAWVQASILATSGGLVIWALIGTIQIIGLTAFHGETRMTFLEAIDDARQALARRRRERNAG